jgi:hypothetical protein
MAGHNDGDDFFHKNKLWIKPDERKEIICRHILIAKHMVFH